MRKGFASRVRRVVDQADIVLEVVDARFPEQTRNFLMEKRIVKTGQAIVVILNKSDLISAAQAKKAKAVITKEFPCVFMSAKERSGKKRILAEIGKATKGKEIRVGVVGYPNTGKSSIINLMKGKKVASTSRKAGFTRGEQLIRISENVMLIDTPGVIPAEERDEFALFLVGSKNAQDLKDHELVAVKLLEYLAAEKPKALKKRYGFAKVVDAESALEEIALHRKRLSKGGKPDLAAAARILLEDWGKGKLN